MITQAQISAQMKRSCTKNELSITIESWKPKKSSMLIIFNEKITFFGKKVDAF